MFDRHLYQPLLHLGNGMDIEIKPVALNEGEKTFEEDLKDYYDENPAIFEGKELSLLRNRSRGNGISFFEAGNFYPDFILWIVEDDQQHVAFVDPQPWPASQSQENPAYLPRNAAQYPHQAQETASQSGPSAPDCA